MDFRSERTLDQIDWSILRELQADARLSYSQLGKRVNLSPPAVAERVRRLERTGVITGYRATVSAPRAGIPVSAFVEMDCEPGRCLLSTSEVGDYPEIVEIHRLTGAHCVMLKVRALSLEHLEGALERIGQHGKTRVSVVLSTQFEGRPVEAQSHDFTRASRSDGWSTS